MARTAAGSSKVGSQAHPIAANQPSSSKKDMSNIIADDNQEPATESKKFATYQQVIILNLDYTRHSRSDEKPKLQARGSRAKVRERLNWDLFNHGIPNLPIQDGLVHSPAVTQAIWDWADENFPAWQGRYTRAINDPLDQVKVAQFAKTHVVNAEKERVEREKEMALAEKRKGKKEGKATAPRAKKEKAVEDQIVGTNFALAPEDGKQEPGVSGMEEKKEGNLEKAAIPTEAFEEANPKLSKKRTASSAGLDEDQEPEHFPKSIRERRIRVAHVYVAIKGTLGDRFRVPGHNFGWQRTMLDRRTTFLYENDLIKRPDYVESMMSLHGTYFKPIDFTDDMDDEEIMDKEKQEKVEVKEEPED